MFLFSKGLLFGGTGKEKGKRHPTIQDNVPGDTGAKYPVLSQ